MTPHAPVTLVVVASLAVVSACRAKGSSSGPSPGASSSAAGTRATSSAAAHGAAVSARPPPVLDLANAPGPAPSGAPATRSVRETAVLALLGDPTFARRLPVVDLEPGREFDPALRDRVAPRIAVPMPDLRLAEGKTEGALPKQVVERIVRQQLGRYRACAANTAPEPAKLAGRVTLELSIEPNGRVGGVGSGGSTLNQGSVVRCIVDAARSLQFPEAPAATRSVQILVLDSPPASRRIP
ncbi:MAG TPA: AgmX/PglI C-terminal domain-containing protein [Polyangiaceae bacterium]